MYEYQFYFLLRSPMDGKPNTTFWINRKIGGYQYFFHIKEFLLVMKCWKIIFICLQNENKHVLGIWLSSGKNSFISILFLMLRRILRLRLFCQFGQVICQSRVYEYLQGVALGLPTTEYWRNSLNDSIDFQVKTVQILLCQCNVVKIVMLNKYFGLIREGITTLR